MCKQVTAEHDLEQGQQLTNMPSNHTSSSTEPSTTPGRAPSHPHDVIDDGSDSIRAMPQRPLELYRVFSMILPAIIIAALESSSNIPIGA
ncbi:hypothetical protein DID88_005190 [Monilinia fructigena]|uniref:Uncharacterized protein n=1 Tax=Monilinia fructigena TaxID=38457 RepID=A0A395IE70_9HELO|nr:hypothetical protein DID88_005190 [Monilinia fructigena]